MPTLTLCVTVDWEGMALAPESLDAMNSFRNAFPDVPLTHFICPAYLTRGGNVGELAARIRSQIRDQDEVALHVHCWRTLVEAAGVEYRDDPTWYTSQDARPTVPYGHGQQDIGHGVPLGAYPPGEVDLILQRGAALLVDHGIGVATPVSFRCGGWMASDPVLQRLPGRQLLHESSCTDAIYFATIAEELRNFECALGDWIPQIWGAANVPAPPYLANTLSRAVRPEGGTAQAQPYAIPVGGVQPVAEVPDNGVLADYLTEEAMYERLRAAWASAAEEDTVHVNGFHQESATWAGWNSPNTTNLQNLTHALARFFDEVGEAAEVGGAKLACGTIGKVGRKEKIAPVRPRVGNTALPKARAAQPARRFWG